MFSLFKHADNTKKTVVEKDPHDEAYVRITSKLLEKRRAIDEALERDDLTREAREEYAMDLLQNQKDLSLFGLSEIDYQAYKEANKDHQLSLF